MFPWELWPDKFSPFLTSWRGKCIHGLEKKSTCWCSQTCNFLSALSYRQALIATLHQRGRLSEACRDMGSDRQTLGRDDRPRTAV